MESISGAASLSDFSTSKELFLFFLCFFLFFMKGPFLGKWDWFKPELGEGVESTSGTVALSDILVLVVSEPGAGRESTSRAAALSDLSVSKEPGAGTESISGVA